MPLFLPRNACGRFTLDECDAMRAGTLHYPYTSAAYDLLPAAKIQQFLFSATIPSKNRIKKPAHYTICHEGSPSAAQRCQQSYSQRDLPWFGNPN